jgi:hypothetical protein
MHDPDPPILKTVEGASAVRQRIGLSVYKTVLFQCRILRIDTSLSEARWRQFQM